MKARLSTRSEWLRRTSWAFFAANVIGRTLLSILGVGPLDQHSSLFWFVGLPATGLWLLLLVAYLTSRLNDGWDDEARRRRAATRSGTT